MSASPWTAPAAQSGHTAPDGTTSAGYGRPCETVPSIGGGVSQFSTTMYNAAYFSGLRIDRQQPHSFYIDRYPPGR